MAAAGLSKTNRAFVSELNRSFPGPFTPKQAAVVADVDPQRVGRLLRHLADQGWVARLQRGLYATVPLEAEDSQTWTSDPWTVAAAVAAPGYIGGWTALHHWDLTDQIFSTVVFVTTRAVPRRERSVGPVRLELRHRPQEAMFGTRRVWRDGVAVDISDRERTLIDCFGDPSLGGGMRHTAEALIAYSESADTQWQRLIEYGDQLGNRTAFKRLGYLAEVLELGDEQLIKDCRRRIKTGVSKLDPALPKRGPVASGWSLMINIELSE
ncbi:MAG: type IV toxin-antitoxin system AbiEi family antitoxin domain-containing protein [Solirubrobacterales bacterium]